VKNILLVHELDATNNLRVVEDHLVCEIFFFVETQEKVLQSASFAKLHHQENAVFTDLIVYVFYYVWVRENLQSTYLLNIFLIVSRLFYCYRLQILLASLPASEDAVSSPNGSIGARTQRLFPINYVVSISVVLSRHK
jgi:hypothetical protein